MKGNRGNSLDISVLQCLRYFLSVTFLNVQYNSDSFEG